MRAGVPISASSAEFSKKKEPEKKTGPPTVNMFGAQIPLMAGGFNPMLNRQADLANKSAAIAKEVEALKAMLGK